MIEFGAATQDITNDIGRPVQGASVNQVAETIRDPMEANVLAIRDGSTMAIIVGCDVVALEKVVHVAIRDAVAEAVGCQPTDVQITCSHTHAGPSVLKTSHFKDIDQAYVERLPAWIADAAKRAVDAMAPAQIRLAKGELALGYNRRCCFDTGQHHMHMARGAGEFTGIEGPADPTHIALYVQREDGSPVAVLHSNSAHPTMMYGANYYSSEYPGEARAIIRRAIGEIPVVYLNGPFGDVAPQDPEVGAGLGGVARVMEMGARLAGETLSLISNAPLRPATGLGHEHTIVTVPHRLPSEKLRDEAIATLERVNAGESVSAWDTMWAHGRSYAWKMLSHDSVEEMPVHVVRLDDLAMVFQPTELYCQFGVDLKRRSLAPMTAVADCSNSFSGYCPTYAGYLGGGYSGDPTFWTRLDPKAGYQIVDEASRMIHTLWKA